MTGKRYRRKNTLKQRILCLLLIVVLTAGLVPGHAFAAGEENTGDRIQIRELPDPDINFKFAFDFDWFDKSSYTYDQHIATLSVLQSQLCHSINSAGNMMAILGFQNITTNGYYTLSEDRPDSIAVMLGQNNFVMERGYTLIDMSVRGLNYDLEWDSNMTVGDKGFHEGFKTARDEALRFLKKYIEDNHITGRVKLWVTGHSRASAVANLVAAYLATDGGAYLSQVNIDPEDIFAYGFATPGTVAEGVATKGEMLSVTAARTEELYKQDTPGKAFNYTGSDSGTILDPADTIYSGIHNVTPEEDLVPYFPPKSWGYTVFGSREKIEYIPDQETMLHYLSRLPGVERYKSYGGPENYKWMTFDLQSLTMVEDKECTDPISQKDFFRKKLDDMGSLIGGTKEYVDGGYQTVFSAVGALFVSLEGKLIQSLTADQTSLIKTGVLTYIAYVKQWYQEKKGVTLSDGEAAEIVLAAVMKMVTGEDIKPDTFTIDDMLYYLFVYEAENIVCQYDPEKPTEVIGFTYKTKLADTIHTTLAQALAKSTGAGEADLPVIKKTVYEMVTAGAYGPQGSSETTTGKEDGRESRQAVYSMIGMGVGETYPDIVTAIGSDGSNRVSVLMDAALPILKTVDLGEGRTETYKTAEEAADALIGFVMNNGLNRLFEAGTIPSTGVRADCFRKYVKTISEHPTELRKFVTGVLLATDGDTFDIPGQIRNAVTFVGQANALLCTHENATYTAWMMSMDDCYPLVDISEKGGKYEESLEVGMHTDENVEIYYTLDGSVPTVKSTKYTGPITLKQTDVRQEITLKAVAVRNNKVGRVWENKYVIEPTAYYQVVEGGGAVWKQGSKSGLTFRVKRSRDDWNTFSMFEGLSVGGKKLDRTSYTAEKGSVILTLSPNYLDTLDAGIYTLTVSFKDARPAETTFAILPEERRKSDGGQGTAEEAGIAPGSGSGSAEPMDGSGSTGPMDGSGSTGPKGDSGNTGHDVKTGDETPITLLLILMGGSLLAIAGIVVYKKKKN